MKLSGAVHTLDQDATLQPEPVSCVWTSFVKFPVPIWHKYQNERTGKSLDVKIKESHQRGLPLTIQQLRRTQKDERLSSALIALDETVWLKAAQIGRHMCVLAKQPQQQQRPCFEFVTVFQEETHDWWGPAMGRKVGCWKSRKKGGEWLQQKNNQIWNKFRFRHLFTVTKLEMHGISATCSMPKKSICGIPNKNLCDCWVIRKVITPQFKSIKWQSLNRWGVWPLLIWEYGGISTLSDGLFPQGVKMAAVKCPKIWLQGAVLKNAISLVQTDPSESSVTFEVAHLLYRRGCLRSQSSPSLNLSEPFSAW